MNERITRIMVNGDWCDVLSKDDVGNYEVNYFGMPYLVNLVNAQAIETVKSYSLEDLEKINPLPCSKVRG